MKEEENILESDSSREDKELVWLEEEENSYLKTKAYEGDPKLGWGGIKIKSGTLYGISGNRVKLDWVFMSSFH